MGNESKKSEFLAIGKWACRYAGVKIIFDNEEQGAYVDIEKRVIHMPKRIAVAEMSVWMATIIHEAMHIKHTPLWLGDIPRDGVDKLIINALEDERIEKHACKQLRAFNQLLRDMVGFVRKDMDPMAVHDPQNYGMQVLVNHAASQSGISVFQSCYELESRAYPFLKKLKERHVNLIERVTPTAFKGHLTEYYKEINELKAILKIKEPPPQEKKEESESEGVGKGIGEDLHDQMRKNKDSGVGDFIDMDGMAVTEHSIPLEQNVRDRIKQALKKSVISENVEGNVLNTDELVCFHTGNIDELFYETKSEKRMKTKVYFLMDVSGSMGTRDVESFDNEKEQASRLDVAHGAFKSINEVVDELKAEDGCDIETEAYVFATSCRKWNMDKGKIPAAGGGTDFYPAMEHVTGKILKEDPSNKRILIVITDGDVNYNEVEETKKLLISTGQDIRVVFVSINDRGCGDEMFKHKITSQETANTAVFESFEEAIDG